MTGVRVLLVESAAAERARLVQALEGAGDIEVVGHAARPGEVLRAVQDLQPDVVVLDLAGGGGQQVIEQVMALAPTPILVLSGTGRASGEAMEALVAGAVDVLPPSAWTPAAEDALRAQVRIVSGVAVVRHRRPRVVKPRPARGDDNAGVTVVAIGASTGGPAALVDVLAGLGGIEAAVLVVQHLHPDFVDGLVAWMARVSPLPVELARDGAQVRAGVVYIAPGDTHLRLDGSDRMVLDVEPEALHRPSVDVLFSSLAARERGRNVGVLLTGMGEDGAKGLLELRQRGDVTIAQDEGTSVVYGMPRAAARVGAAEHVLPLDQVARCIARSV